MPRVLVIRPWVDRGKKTVLAFGMDSIARRQLNAEAGNWLSRGRGRLLSRLIERYSANTEDILEIGAGAGANVPMLAQYGYVDAVEVDPRTWPLIEQRAGLRRLYRDPIPDFEPDGLYDVICAMDVIEYMNEDREALRWVSRNLRPLGTFIGVVPAYPWFYGRHDRAVGNLRRYSRRGFLEVFPRELRSIYSGYFVSILFPVAIAARFTWTMTSVVGPKGVEGGKQSSMLPRYLDSLFGRVLEFEAWIASLGLPLPFGLSVVCVARKKG